MNNELDILSKLIDFITNNFWTVRKDTSLNSRLDRDIGFVGDDALEFLEKFLMEFDIKHDPQKINVSNYFNLRYNSILREILVLLRLKKKLPKPKYDLTLGHLVKVIELGYWIDMPDENRSRHI